MFDLPIDRQIELARQLLPDLEVIPGSNCAIATCPGADCHSTTTKKRDFMLWFDPGKGPHEHCHHRSCAGIRHTFMQQLYSLLRKNDPAVSRRQEEYNDARRKYLAAPQSRPAPFELYSPDEAARAAEFCPVMVDDEWLLERSPIRIPADHSTWPALLLNSLYPAGSKILVFTKFASQGQILHTVGHSTVRLEERPPAPGQLPGRRPPSGFPSGAQNGCWFLASPITGEWEINENNRDAHGAKLGRRHAKCCTSFPYLVLESDEAPPSIWLRILVQLRDPIVAVYTSGGKSYHALVRVSAPTKAEFDIRRREYATRLAALGADTAAITAVRLTRLPGCWRFGTGEGPEHRPYIGADGKPAPRLQRLLYLNPEADGTPILDLAL